MLEIQSQQGSLLKRRLSSGDAKYVLKEVPKENYQIRRNIYSILNNRTQYVRPLEDTVEENAILVHKYFNNNLLTLVQRGLPPRVTRKVLKDVLRGLADLHELDIVHNGNIYSYGRKTSS